MSDIKFSCPQCGQHITCDELCMGMEVQCPGCQQTLTVPQIAPAPAAPPPPTQPRITINRTAHQPAATAAAPPPRTMPTYRTFNAEPEPKKGGVKKIITIALVVMAFGVGGYFGFNWVYHLQQKTNEQMAEAAKNSGGGEMGETAAIYKTLDATDPDKMRTPSYSDLPGTRLARRATANANAAAASAADEGDDAATAKSPVNDLPVIPATYTLDANAATIPEGRVNGAISASPFVADIIRFDVASTYQVLRFTQGSLTSPDREVLVYLHLKTGESPTGKTLLVNSDSHAMGNPSVVKNWKTNPKYAPTSKTFTTGYALKIEFTGLTPGVLSGKIYLALPDAEKTVVAGVFQAQTSF